MSVEIDKMVSKMWWGVVVLITVAVLSSYSQANSNRTLVGIDGQANPNRTLVGIDGTDNKLASKNPL